MNPLKSLQIQKTPGDTVDAEMLLHFIIIHPTCQAWHILGLLRPPYPASPHVVMPSLCEMDALHGIPHMPRYFRMGLDSLNPIPIIATRLYWDKIG